LVKKIECFLRGHQPCLGFQKFFNLLDVQGRRMPRKTDWTVSANCIRGYYVCDESAAKIGCKKINSATIRKKPSNKNWRAFFMQVFAKIGV
jgi:hypothetical protein